MVVDCIPNYVRMERAPIGGGMLVSGEVMR
jgi:hypothetical protein